MMLKMVDRLASLSLVAFATGHAIPGTLMVRPLLETYTMWSVSGSLAAYLIAGLNWLRVGRPGDRAIAAWALAGALAWIILMIWLMEAAQMWADVRPWLFIAVCAVLAGFSIAGLFRPQASTRTF